MEDDMSSMRIVTILASFVALASCSPMTNTAAKNETPAAETTTATPAATDAAAKPEDSAAAPTDTAAKPEEPAQAPTGAVPDKPA
jgi:hypothetical protein